MLCRLELICALHTDVHVERCMAQYPWIGIFLECNGYTYYVHDFKGQGPPTFMVWSEIRVLLAFENIFGFNQGHVDG